MRSHINRACGGVLGMETKEYHWGLQRSKTCVHWKKPGKLKLKAREEPHNGLLYGVSHGPCLQSPIISTIMVTPTKGHSLEEGTGKAQSCGLDAGSTVRPGITSCFCHNLCDLPSRGDLIYTMEIIILKVPKRIKGVTEHSY